VAQFGGYEKRANRGELVEEQSSNQEELHDTGQPTPRRNRQGENVAFNDLDPEQFELVSNPEAVQKISQSLAAIMIERKLSLNVMLGGVLAFLMALSASGHGDNELAGRKLREMSDYFLQTGEYSPDLDSHISQSGQQPN
jgi:hypothetical protein